MMDGPTMTREDSETKNSPDADETGPRSRPLFRILGILFLGLAVLLGIYGTVFQVAWQRGQDLGEENAKSALEAEMASQLLYAEEDVTAGNITLAKRRLEWILEQDATYPAAVELRRQLLEAGDTHETPTPFPSPTSLPQIAATAPPGSEPAGELADLERIVGEEEWQEAVTAIISFQARFPDFQRRQTDTMLYNAYLNLGQNLLSSDQVELGLYYMTQAEKLGDLPSEAKDQQLWADIYLLGISYYGVDWSVAVYYFRDLCAAAPFFQNSCVKLHEALISYGDQYAANLDWCPAAELYVEAVQLNNEPIAAEKRQEARSQCLEATPTPTTPITATESVSSIFPVFSDGF